MANLAPCYLHDGPAAALNGLNTSSSVPVPSMSVPQQRAVGGCCAKKRRGWYLDPPLRCEAKVVCSCWHMRMVQPCCNGWVVCDSPRSPLYSNRIPGWLFTSASASPTIRCHGPPCRMC